MNCDALSSRLSTVKQTYTRQNKPKKSSNAINHLPSQIKPAAKVPIPLVPKIQLSAKPRPPTTSSPSKVQPKPATVRVEALTVAAKIQNPIIISKTSTVVTKSEPSIVRTKVQQVPLPVSKVESPNSLILKVAPCRTVPNILRRTPSKQGPPLPKPSKPRTNSVNLSPMLYSPTLKTKNPFQQENRNSSSQARVITSYLKVVSPRKKSVGSQCKLDSRQIKSPNRKISPTKPTNPPRITNPSEQIVCNVDERFEDTILVTHCINGKVYSGLLLAERLRTDITLPSYGYQSEQLPSQYHKKLKAKLGLSFDSGCDSENSDTESAKAKLKKLKYSDFKAMKDTISESSTNTEPVLAKPSTVMFECSSVPTARPNVPYQNACNHNKKSINGLADFLNERPSSASKASIKPIVENKSSTNKQQSFKCSDQPSCKKQKSEKSSVSLHTDSQKKSDNPTFIAYIESDDKKSKIKFGEKFLTPKTTGPTTSTVVPDEIPDNSVSEPAARNYKMRSKSQSGGEKTMWNTLLRQNSTQLKYVDLEWPVWCPRKLQLVITPTKCGKPARFKLLANGSKRRRVSSESTVSEGQDEKEEIFTENNNPYGIGDVVIAKRILCPGRPYWPGKILSVTGLTVCVLFYNTPEVMQLAKCNVEWYYDACSEHRIVYDPTKDSKEWKAALSEAEKDVKSCIGVYSIVWGLYEDEWWPARVVDIDHKNTHTVMWLDDGSLEPLTLATISPFLLAFNVRYDREVAEQNKSYRYVVESAQREALLVLLDTKSEIEREEREAGSAGH